MTRHRKLPAPEKAADGKAIDFESMTELDILIWNRSVVLTMIASIKAAVDAGDVYPQIARELASLSGKVKQFNSEIRQREKDGLKGAKKLSPAKRLRACIELARQLPKEGQREAAKAIAQLAGEAGLSA